MQATEKQTERFAAPGSTPMLKWALSFLKRCEISQVGANLLKTTMERLNLSARAYNRILKVSRTIADVAGTEEIRPEHLA